MSDDAVLAKLEKTLEDLTVPVADNPDDLFVFPEREVDENAAALTDESFINSYRYSYVGEFIKAAKVTSSQ